MTSAAPQQTGPTGSAHADLLDTRRVLELERLSVVSLEAVLAGFSGVRPRGAGAPGMEFEDFRPYVPGDDLRYVDWNIHARLGELYVKLSPRERRARLDVLIDLSRSMDFGEPSKLLHARRIAAALGAVALLHEDAVRVYGLSGGHVQSGTLLEGAGSLSALSGELQQLGGRPETDLPSAVRAYARLAERTDLTVMVTDALVPADQMAVAARELAAGTERFALVHVLDRSEQQTGPIGQLQLRDSESGRLLELRLGRRSAARYRELAERFRARVERAVRDAGGRYLPAPTELDALDLLATVARGEGLVTA